MGNTGIGIVFPSYALCANEYSRTFCHESMPRIEGKSVVYLQYVFFRALSKRHQRKSFDRSIYKLLLFLPSAQEDVFSNGI